MKRIIAMGVILNLAMLGGISGCAEKTKTEKKTTVTTPNGKTTTTTTTEVEKSGDNPPPARP
jgi:hypothetical protein